MRLSLWEQLNRLIFFKLVLGLPVRSDLVLKKLQDMDAQFPGEERISHLKR